MSGGGSGKGPGMDVDRLRAETPGTEHRIHLNNAGAALMSRRTLAAMTEQLELEAAIGGYEALERVADRVEATYAGMARLLGARREEIAFFDNSTHAWNAAFCCGDSPRTAAVVMSAVRPNASVD